MPRTPKNATAPTVAEPTVPLTVPQRDAELVLAAAPPAEPAALAAPPVFSTDLLAEAMRRAKSGPDPLEALGKFALDLRLTDLTPSFEPMYALARSQDDWLRAAVAGLDDRALDLVWVADGVMRGRPVVTAPQPLRRAQLPDVAGDGGGSPLLLVVEAAAEGLSAWLDAHVVPFKARRLVGGAVSVRTDYEQNSITAAVCDRAAGVWKDFLDRVGRWPVALYTSTPDYCRKTAKAFDPFGSGEARLLPTTPAELEASEGEFRRERLARVLAQTQSAGGYRLGSDPTR